MSLVALPCLLQTQNTLANTNSTWTGTAYFENDLFADTDKDYTNGVRFSAVSPNVNDFTRDPNNPNWARSIYKLADYFDPEVGNRDHRQRNLVATIGQKMYTPRDINRTSIDPDDRPYAGWLYGGIAYQGRTNNKLNVLALNIGVVGPASLAKETQDLVHDLRGIDKFQGWHNQLNNELGLQIAAETKHRWHQVLPLKLELDAIGHTGFSLGNVATYINTGAEIRFGYQLPDDFGTSSLRIGGDNSTPGRFDNRSYIESRNQNFGAHLFAASDARLVFHDIFLDGNTFSESHSVDKEPLVADLVVGFVTTYQGFKLSLARVHRTREFKTQNDSHHFGSITLSYSFQY